MQREDFRDKLNVKYNYVDSSTKEIYSISYYRQQQKIHLTRSELEFKSNKSRILISAKEKKQPQERCICFRHIFVEMWVLFPVQIRSFNFQTIFNHGIVVNIIAITEDT